MNSLIINTLSPTNVPVVFQVYGGKETTYITFFEYNQNGSLFAEDVEDKTRHSIQVDVWSQGNYSELVKQVRDLMVGAGFTRVAEHELYEPETRVFHKAFRFYYTRLGA